MERPNTRRLASRRGRGATAGIMRIRTLFLLCLSATAAIALLVAGKLVVDASQDRRAALQAGEALGVVESLLGIADQLANERGAYSNLLGRDGAADAKDREVIAGKRAIA